MAPKPEELIAPESFEGLDSTTRDAIRDAIKRGVRQVDLDYLLLRWAYAQVVDGGEQAAPKDPVDVVKSTHFGWTVCDYGNAMSSSPGENYILGSGAFRVRFGDEDDDGGGGDSVRPGTGTIINQIFTTAEFMVGRIVKQGWASMHIVSCSKEMGKALWVRAQQADLSVTGYEPSEQDYRTLSLMQASREHLQSQHHSVVSRSGGGG